MDLDLSDHFLLLMLREDPFISPNELAEAMNISANTVRARIQRLKKVGLLRGDSHIDDAVLGRRTITEVFATPNYSSLGLRRIDVLLIGIKDKKALQSIYHQLDNHPYTIYRSFGFSMVPMIYTVFAMPEDPFGYLRQFLQGMKDTNLFQDYLIFQFPYHISTKEMLDYWNIHLGQWDYDISSLEFTSHKIPEQREEFQQKFTCLDLMLLRELTINAKVKIKDLSNHYKNDRTTISRHMRYVKENLVQDYGIIYDRTVFNLGNFRIYWGEWERKSPIVSLMEGRFPFNSNISYDRKHFVWLVQASNPILNDLSLLLFNETKQLNQAIIYTETGLRYYFYPNNYDCENRRWKYGAEYLLIDKTEENN